MAGKGNSIPITYKGVTYPSTVALCKAFGISMSAFNYARDNGKSVVQAIEELQLKGYKYNGKKYRSYRELAEAVGIPPYLLYNRICNSVGKNMTIEEAIQTPVKNASECAAKPITVNGVNYRTQSEAMQAYGIKVGHFYRTLKLCGGDKELAFKQCISEGEKQ